MKCLQIILTGAAVGLVSGILWFWIGEKLDNHLGNFAAWYIAPAVLPLLIAGVLWIRKFDSNVPMTLFLFIVVYYSFHWLPMLVLLLYFWLFNIKM